MEQKKPTPRPRTKKYQKSTDHVAISDATRAGLPSNSQRLLPGVNELLDEVKQLKQQLSVVKEERDEFQEEVKFFKYQLAYRAQVQDLQKNMSEKKEKEIQAEKKQKSVRFSSSISIENAASTTDEELSDSEPKTDDSFTSNDGDWEEFNRLKAEKEELEDVLYDFYHDSKMANSKERVLVGDIDSHPSESTSSLICRVLVNYEKLSEEKRILEEEKSKLDEDKLQLCTSMAKLREQLHDAVDSNIEEIEDLNRENEELRFKLSEKDGEVKASSLRSREGTISSLKLILELATDKIATTDKIAQRLKRDISRAENELKEARNLANKPQEEKDSKVKRTKSLPPSFRQANKETTERGGLLRELKTCKDIQESQRKQIQKILEEKLELEVKLSEIKRQIVLLKAERRAHIKTKSKHVQTGSENVQGGNATVKNAGQVENSGQVEIMSRKCKELEKKLEEAKQEKSTVEEEKTCLLMSLDANIEKKDTLEEQLRVLQEKLDGVQKERKPASTTRATSTQTNPVKDARSETDGGLNASYKKDISQVKAGIERIRIQEQDKQMTILKRENDAVREKLKKSEGMLQTLQNCLKELTDEKHDLLDSIEELNGEKAELEEARLKLEKELGGEKREQFVADEVSDIRKKERKLVDDIEACKAKLTQLDLNVVEVLSLFGNGGPVNEPNVDSRKGVEDMIGSLLLTVENLKRTVSSFKTTYDQAKGESLQMKSELQATSDEKYKLQSKVEALNKKIKDLTVSLESDSTSRVSYESRVTKELDKMRAAKAALEKSFSVGRKREAELERQLKVARDKRDELQRAFDLLTRKCNDVTSLLAEATKEVEQARRTNEKFTKEVERAPRINEKLTKEIEQLREDLEGTVEDRDELLELLDRIVCENGSGEERLSLGRKVERIRERSKSEETLVDIGAEDSKQVKAIHEKYLVSSLAKVEYASPVDDELFSSTTSTGVVKTNTNKKRTNELVEENQRLKEMVEEILNDQKKMEVALSSFSEANVEIQQGLKESIEHTEQIRVQGSEDDRHGRDVVDHGADGRTKGMDSPTKVADNDNENAELRKLHEEMISTNEALSAHMRHLQEGKARTEQLRSSWQEVSSKNVSLEEKLEGMAKEKTKIEMALSTLEGKRRKFEKDNERVKKEKQDLQSMLDDSKARVKDLKVHMDSLTEINKDLRETNEGVVKTSKEAEKKTSKTNREFDESEARKKALEKVNKQLQKEVAELGQQKTGAVLELERSKGMIVVLKDEVAGHSKRTEEQQRCIDSNEQELKILRETASKFSKMEAKAEGVGTLKSENETLKKTVAEHEKRVEESDTKIAKLKKEIENSQRFVKVVSQENDSLRDALSEWEREASKIRKHVHQVSQDAERRKETGDSSPLVVRKELPLDSAEGTGMSVKALEAMQVEMDAVNKHLKSLTGENKVLTSSVKTISEENNEMKEQSIQLLTKYDMLGKEMEKKDLEMNKLREDVKNASAHSQTNIQSRDKFERENSVLQTNCGKLEKEISVLRNSLGNTLDEERALGERLKRLVESWKPDSKRAKNSSAEPKTIISDDKWIMKSDSGGLATAKPDLIRHSKEVKDESAVEEAKYKNEYFALENTGGRKDAQEIIKGVSNERATLKTQCEDVARVFHEINSRNTELKKQLGETTATKGKKEGKKTKKTDLKGELEKKQTEVTELTEEKKKLENEAAVIKEKSDKLQAVFRALILVMNDKKSDKVGRQSNGSEGPTGLIDYIKNIKTRYTGLVTEKENLEEKVKRLQQELEECQAKAKSQTEGDRSKDGGKENDDPSRIKAVLEEKGRILKELLLTSARDKRRFVEKLQEVYDEFDRVKTELGEELRKQRKSSPASVLILEKVHQELIESVTHTETFVQSVVHERRVTVVAETASEKDADLELAKENEELIGRINAIKSSRRRETKSLKEELTKMSEEKEDTVREMEAKCKSEIAAAKEESEKTAKENEEVVSELKSSWKKEVDQLKNEITRISDENDKANRTLQNESRLAVELLEGKIKTSKLDMDKVVAEKKAGDLQMAEMRRKYAAETKEKDRLAESEISHVRANWAEAERKVRAAAEKTHDSDRELQRVKLEKSEQETKAAREMQKSKANLAAVQKQSLDKEDGFKRETDRLQQTISVLEQAFKKSEVSGLERTQTRISGFQRSLDELAHKNKRLESEKSNSEANLSAELEIVKHDNLNLQRELRGGHHEQRRVVVNTKEQHRRMESALPPPVVERVKVLSAVKQPAVDKPRLVSPLESAAPVPIQVQGDPQRRVKVRESQTAVIHKGRVKEQGVRRPSDHNDAVCEELGAMFRQLNDEPEWADGNRSTTSVIHARPVQKVNQVNQVNSFETQQQKPQPEWETARQDRTWPIAKEPRRAPVARQQETPSPTIGGRLNSQPYPQRPVNTRKNDPYNRPPISQPSLHSRPATTQVRNTTETPNVTTSSADDLDRQPVEVRRPAAVERAAKSLKPRHGQQRPSFGSDEVFVSENTSTFMSHGAKNSDFWRSRSLDDLTDIPDDNTNVRQQNHNHVSKKHKPKLPKSFSGPRNFDSSTRDVQPGGMASRQNRNAKDKKAVKVTPLKGMEYVIFQHQL